MKVGVVSVDARGSGPPKVRAYRGTKMEANAALAANKKHEGLEKEIEREVAKMLAEAESVDREEDGRLGKKRGDPKSRALRGGQIKDARGCKRFNLRGLDGASGEWKLICGTHNLLKLWRHVCRQAGSGRASRN